MTAITNAYIPSHSFAGEGATGLNNFQPKPINDAVIVGLLKGSLDDIKLKIANLKQAVDDLSEITKQDVEDLTQPGDDKRFHGLISSISDIVDHIHHFPTVALSPLQKESFEQLSASAVKVSDLFKEAFGCAYRARNAGGDVSHAIPDVQAKINDAKSELEKLSAFLAKAPL